MKLYDNYIVIGSFNLELSNATLKDFLDSNGVHILLEGHTCLILTNRKFSFENIQSFKTGLSDHMVHTMLKITF